jgi:hypothetical protein
MAIPFLDLKAQYASIKPEIDAAVMGVLETCGFIGGENLKRFERNFASYMGASYAVGSCSGTSALHLALLGAGVKRGVRSSPLSTPSLPRRRPSRTRAPSPCLWMSRKPPADRSPASKRHHGEDNRHCAGSPLRTARRHGRHS